MFLAEARTLTGAVQFDHLQLRSHEGEDIAGLDQDSIVHDLASDMDGYDPVSYFQHFSFQDYHQLLLAYDQRGRCKALLGTTVSNVDDGTWLNLVTGFLVNEVQGQGLMRHMIAQAVLQLSQRGILPGLMAARTYNPVWYRMLYGIGATLPGSTFYPRIDGGVQGSALARLATEAVSRTNPGTVFQADLGVIRGGLVKTPSLFRFQRPRCGSDSIDTFFHTELGALDLVLTLLDIRGVASADRSGWLGSATGRKAAGERTATCS